MAPTSDSPKPHLKHSTGTYYRLPELLALDNGGMSNEMLGFLRETPKELAHLTKELAKKGFRKFSYAGAGNFSLVLHTTEKQLVRIAFAHPQFPSAELTYHPAILQPIDSFPISSKTDNCTGFRIDIMPEIIFDDRITLEHEHQVASALRESGLNADDIVRRNNVGLIEVKGRLIPLLVDRDRIKRIPRESTDDRHLKPWLSEDGTWLQVLYDPRIATHQPTGIASDATLGSVKRVLTGPDTLVGRILNATGIKKRRTSQLAAMIEEVIGKEGEYSSAIQAKVAEAVSQFEAQSPDDKTSFSDVLRKQREKKTETSPDHFSSH